MSTENEKYLASLAHKGNHNFDLFHGSYEVIETARYKTSSKAIILKSCTHIPGYVPLYIAVNICSVQDDFQMALKNICF